MSDTAHILVVDDQHEICDVVQEYLTGEGYRVSVAHDGGGMRRVRRCRCMRADPL